MTGAATAVSTVTVCSPFALTLPATSVATALMVVLSSVGTSPEAKLAVQLPSVAVTVLVVVPQVTETLAPASAVPLTATPAVFSAVFTTLSAVTCATTGAATVVSTTTTKPADEELTLPFWSVISAVNVCSLSAAPAKLTSMTLNPTATSIEVTGAAATNVTEPSFKWMVSPATTAVPSVALFSNKTLTAT